jgi:hypothetical protein
MDNGITITRRHPLIGAEIPGINLARIDDNTFRRICDAWLEHLLLAFPSRTSLTRSRSRSPAASANSRSTPRASTSPAVTRRSTASPTSTSGRPGPSRPGPPGAPARGARPSTARAGRLADPSGTPRVTGDRPELGTADLGEGWAGGPARRRCRPLRRPGPGQGPRSSLWGSPPDQPDLEASRDGNSPRGN